ncbi:flagellar protein FlaG [Clostridium butyricum]|uniref:flagellar protein FlaG n=1 Tax=Clostridium butyricum TaxID=1492 RepID=UPI003466BF9F
MSIDSIGSINSGYYINTPINEAVVGEAKETQTFKKSSDSELNNSNSQEQPIDKKKLDKSLDKLNRFLEDESAHAEYSIHEDFGTIMIKIIDDNTKKVILEIPPKKILDMIASMCKQFGLLDKKV